ncbi:MAG: 23S rRNA (adenine(2503)-C(2))-methyltransferase RlmN [Clostridia bacterium]|nr:23S rRNA (adenine(2503)-C(2))-methyltransferase RlmN [Clostridia bacterium]
MKDCLLNYDYSKLEEIIIGLGEKKFRAGQIFRGLYLGLDFSEMSDISKPLREKLLENFDAQPVSIIKKLVSADGTEKYLFKLRDGNIVEGVLMKYKYGNSICISTQVGCRMNCAFCASGLAGLIRNLEPAEILGEVIAVNRLIEGGLADKRKITNIVLMGSGEPLDNYDNVVSFLRLVSAKEGINISARNISLSTCGIVPKIYKLADEKIPVNLTISLHSPIDSERQEIMPIAKSYTIEEILKACEYYFEKTGRRYIFEYVLIKEKNDTERHVKTLISILKGRPCHVNLIRLNDVKEKNLQGGTEKDAYRFMGALEKGGISATVRRKMGEDIEGACGQLRRSYIENNEIKKEKR